MSARRKTPSPASGRDLVARSVMTEAEADKVHQEAIKEMDEAVKFAEDSPYPGAEEIYTDI